jgi:hypothetical protein
MPYHTLVVSLLAVVAVVLIVSGLVEAGTAAKVKEPIGWFDRDVVGPDPKPPILSTL